MILICLLGFMYTGENIAHHTICNLCNKVLQNGSLSPAKLHRHYAVNRLEYKDKNMSFFSHKLEPFTNC